MPTFAPTPAIVQRMHDAALLRQIERIAAIAVVAVVETDGLSLDTYHGTAYDMRPAIDTAIFADEEIELVRDHVNLGLDAGWLQSVPGSSRYVVQITWVDQPLAVAALAGTKGAAA
jgi:hypothetical protein